MKRAVAAAALCALGAACAQDISSPVKVVAMAWSTADKAYELGPVPLATLTSLRHLRGGAGTVQVGGSVHAAASTIAAPGATVESLRRSLISASPGDADLNFDLSGNVAYAEDADSLQLMTAYYNLEQARAAFGRWGLQTLPPAIVVAGASVVNDAGQAALARSEMYFQPLETHYLPAPDAKTQLPLGMNLGAMAHSLMHQAIALQAWANAPVAPTDTGSTKDPAWTSARHVSRSLSEGMADFIGAQVTGDAHWLDHSDQQDANTRALDQLWCGSQQMADALPLDDSKTPYNPYPLGSVLAGILWDAAQASQGDTVPIGTLQSLPALKTAVSTANGQITLQGFLDAMMSAMDPDDLPVLCGLVLDRFAAMGVTSLPTCDPVTPAKPDQRCVQ